MLETDLLGGVFAAPAYDVFDAEFLVALFALGPDDGEAEADAGNAAPCAEEIALVGLGLWLFC